MIHFVKSEKEPDPTVVNQPGSVVRTACGEFDYIGPDGKRGLEIRYYPETVVAAARAGHDGPVCGECLAIASIVTLDMPTEGGAS